jgi:ribosome-binding factor A
MVSIIGAPDEAEVVEALNSSAGFIRTYLKPMMRIRHMPSLKFFLDESAKHNAQISAILQEIEKSN